MQKKRLGRPPKAPVIIPQKSASKLARESEVPVVETLKGKEPSVPPAKATKVCECGRPIVEDGNNQCWNCAHRA